GLRADGPRARRVGRAGSRAGAGDRRVRRADPADRRGDGGRREGVGRVLRRQVDRHRGGQEAQGGDRQRRGLI
ncbi:MAG: hypothetical protein AVDCRST_MAG30-1468, partial [uncultured Solirubrobacteraceae bacterium]